MATEKQIANLKPIKKGEVLNPLGVNAQNPALRMVRRLSRAQIAEMGTMVLESNLAELEKVANDPQSTVLRVMFASVAVTAIKKGDAKAMALILEQVAGRPKEHVQLSGNVGLSKYEGMTPEELQARMRELARKVIDVGKKEREEEEGDGS